MGIFDKRVAFKPFEYPRAAEFVEVMQSSIWNVNEFNFTQDIQDFNTRLTEHEKEVVRRSLLAISQIEVSVKTFWAKLYEHFPKAEFNQLGVMMAYQECFSEDTEFLTADGFKKYSDIDDDTLVAQMDLTTKEITFEKPLGRIRKKYVGDMHLYSSKNTNLLVTPNHDLVVIHPLTKKVKKEKSINGVWGKNYLYFSSGFSNKKDKGLTWEERLFIAIQADATVMQTIDKSGSNRRDVVFNLRKPRKIERLLNILENCRFEYKVKPIIHYGVEFSKITVYLPEPINLKTLKTFEWVDLEDVSVQWGREFIEELKKWDASSQKDGKKSICTYYNTREKAVDKVTEIAMLCGFRTKKAVNRHAGEEHFVEGVLNKKIKATKTCYAVHITDTTTTTYPMRKEIHYDGYVNCFTMSKGTVIVRREGCVAVSGNCVHEQSYSKLLEILHLNGDFEQVLQVPEIKGRVEYLQKYMKGASDNAKQNYALNVALFSAFIENCSLFSQFFIMKSMNYHKGYFKGVDNVISATFLEEDLHANVGAWIIATIREEYPDFFDDDFRKKMIRACHKAYDAELNIVRWILQGQDLEYVTFNMVDNFLKYRFNKSMEMMGYEKLFEVDAEEQKKFEWFNAEVALDKHVDFFNKRPTNYARDLEDVTEDSIFG